MTLVNIGDRITLMRSEMYNKPVNIVNKVVGCRFNDDDYKELYFRSLKRGLSVGQYVKVFVEANLHKTKIKW